MKYSNKAGSRMIGLLLIIAAASMFAALGIAAMRWGVDTRDWSTRSR
jgi:hypothetical protein